MFNSCQTLLKLMALALLALVPFSANALTLAQEPLFLIGSVKPQVMLDISKDQQLYKRAYNDYSDLDDDGQFETTYKHSIDYYGYFDSYKCYTYSSGRFVPASVTANKYCSGAWSGNFLNWATMTRMDAVRKLLYGGTRSTDSTSETVLERAYIPTDAHSWAKYYKGSDIAQLTPYSPPIAPTAINTSNSNNSAGIGTGLKKFRVGSDTTSFAVGDQVIIRDHSDPTNTDKYMIGAVSCVKGTGINMYNGIAASANSCSSSDNEIGVVVERTGGTTGGSNKDWDIYNYTQTGITICNTTLGPTVSQSNTNPPLMRVAQGNFGLWAANERWQCLWRDEASSPGESTSLGGTRTNGNRAAITGLYASSVGPNQSSSAGKINNAPSGYGDFNVRVQACVTGLINKEKCQQYPGADGNLGNADDTYKPIGLLQVYGDPDQIQFGLMTGSYTKNISGGVLRKNMGTFTDEVNKDTYGTFTSTVGIVKTLDRMRLYGYSYTDGGYYNTADNCPWQLTSINEGSCSTWGNPMSEVYYESLRYFAGKSAIYNYTNAGSKDAALGLPQPAWTAPLSNANYCAPLNVLAFNASVSTNDFDLAGTTMTAINSGSTAAALANLVGSGEGIPGNNYFVGANGGINNELCSAKTVGNLGSIYGICPEGPTLLGSYLMPGMAYHARTNKIRTDLTVPATDTKSLKVATYGVQLATNVPQVRVALLGETQPRVIIQPAYRLFNTAPQGGGALVDMKIVNQVATSDTASGQIYLNWEDSEQGGDYDQDVWGVLTYCLTTVSNGCGAGTSANRVYVTTKTIAESTGNGQGFGYIISGTTQDGPHFHSGIEGFSFTDPTNISVSGGSVNASGGCNNCQLANTASTATYTLGTNAASALKDPLYYASKWGGFNDLDGDGVPSSATEWDVLNADGTPSLVGGDGIPDNYFFVSNPLGLEKALNAAFLKILKDSSASAVATNSSTLNTGSRIFQGRFSNSSWSGQLLSYRLDNTNGSVLSAASPPPNWDASELPYPEWDAGQQVNTQLPGDRLILTTGATGSGADFVYGNLSAGQQGALNLDAFANTDNCGLERVAFLRGDKSKEGTGTFTCASTNTIFEFRSRDVSVLGDVINSNPVFVGAPGAGYSDVDHPGYSAFVSKFKDRKPVVYFGANDGMLHGIDTSVVVATNLPTSTAGKEVLAYVPSMVYGNLSRLTDSNYKAIGSHRYFVDSSPMVADVCTASCAGSTAVWKSMLVSGLGAGGKGFFALNVTNPDVAAQDGANTPLFNVAQAANIVMWEFKSDADLGYTFNNSPTKLSNGQARQIAKFENGRWGVVLGNGYNSADGKAVLYVLFVNGPTGAGGTWQAGGVDYVRIVADAGTGNGLSAPVPFDSDGDGLVDTVYAGDLKGNMWKFDLSDPAPVNWTSASLLYAAKDGSNNAQPIINSPEVTLHPSSGYMVLFGTGKFLETADTTSTAVQTFYAIQDTGSLVGGRTALNPQTINSTTIGGVDYRTVTTGCGASPLPACPTTPQGWYADLPTSGERTTGTAKLTAGNIFFNTFIPSVSPCEFGGTGWLMSMNYWTGAQPSPGIFDTNKDGVIDSYDTAVTGTEVGAALGGTTLIKGSGNNPGVGVSSTTKGETRPDLLNLGAGTLGRITWREIIQ